MWRGIIDKITGSELWQQWFPPPAATETTVTNQAILNKQQEMIIGEAAIAEWITRHLRGYRLLTGATLRMNDADELEGSLTVCYIGTIHFRAHLTDLWHDRLTSTLEMRLSEVSLENRLLVRLPFGRLLCWFVLRALQHLWQFWGPIDTKDHFRLRLLEESVRVDIQNYLAGAESMARRKRLLRNLVIIGGEVQDHKLLLHIHRVPPQRWHRQEDTSKTLADPRPVNILEIGHWLLLIFYVFILIHLTFPIAQTAFTFVSSDIGQGMRFLLSQLYNVLVVIFSFFFLRLTMFPFRVHWWRYKHEVSLLRMEEEKDRQYLRILDKWFKEFREMYRLLAHHPVGNKKLLVRYRQQLRNTIREVGLQRERLARKQEYIDKQHWNWVRQIAVGYLISFGLEGLYVKGILPPLQMTLDWVNAVLTLLLQ